METEENVRHISEVKETDDSYIVEFKKSMEKDDIIKTYRKKSEFTPKSVERQQKIKDKLRKSRENGKG